MVRKMALAIVLLAAGVVQAADSSPTRGDPARGKAVAEKICVACHMADGNSTVAANPKLAGQIEPYLVKQLHNFRSLNGKPAARVNAIMAGMAGPLSEQEIRDVAAWFAAQKQVPAAPKDLALVVAGQKIWRQGDFKKGIPACAGCHGPAGGGISAQYPRLSGQFPEYIEAQLKAFRQGERHNDAEAMMRTIAARMSDSDIKSVAEYIAALR